MDFSDEEAVSVFAEKKGQVRRGVVESVGVVSSLLDASRVGSKMREGLGVVILGPPNCGKSNLLNALAKEELIKLNDFSNSSLFFSLRKWLNLFRTVLSLETN